MQKKLLAVLRYWLPLAVAITCLSGLIYVTVQQSLRQSANDPQIQLTEDLSISLSHGANPQDLIPLAKTDAAHSLAPFIMVFDPDGNPIATSVVLDEKNPQIPPGVFDYTKQHGEDRFTWQPRSGVRAATVMKYFSGQKNGFVLAARSLREVEKRESDLTVTVASAWIGTEVITLLTTFFLILI